jgi:hypothetical protein
MTVSPISRRGTSVEVAGGFRQASEPFGVGIFGRIHPAMAQPYADMVEFVYFQDGAMTISGHRSPLVLGAAIDPRAPDPERPRPVAERPARA